ncbi:hypothetical protein SDC9_169000 [bioreactor metagenome]|uniref:Uncharacterized protein n=1 Tax=bioreactor metagenome TaxID=1076179 RepID=A0A645G6M2_9ZZZZ
MEPCDAFNEVITPSKSAIIPSEAMLSLLYAVLSEVLANATELSKS